MPLVEQADRGRQLARVVAVGVVIIDHVAQEHLRRAAPKLDRVTYRFIQGHTSLTGWEPPNVPALWGRV